MADPLQLLPGEQLDEALVQLLQLLVDGGQQLLGALVGAQLQARRALGALGALGAFGAAPLGARLGLRLVAGLRQALLRQRGCSGAALPLARGQSRASGLIVHVSKTVKDSHAMFLWNFNLN